MIKESKVYKDLVRSLRRLGRVPADNWDAPEILLLMKVFEREAFRLASNMDGVLVVERKRK